MFRELLTFFNVFLKPHKPISLIVNIFHILLFLVSALFAGTSASFASGTGDYGQESLFQTKADHFYEQGKSIFYAKGADGNPINYCIKKAEQLERVSRRSLRQFENTSAEELSAHLRDCDQPEQMIEQQFNDRQLSAMIYYLNKRYRLSLYSNS